MDVFISWSGTASHKIALALRDWLPTVLQAVDTWVSSEDIAKGRRWSDDLASKLNDCHVGIICVNSSNVLSPWLNFEAGAISNKMPKAKVFPVLHGISPSALVGPLSQFQVTCVEIEDFRKLVKSIHESEDDSRIPWERINKTFENCWTALHDELSAVEFIINRQSNEKIGINDFIQRLERVGFTVEKGGTIMLGVSNAELAMWLSLDGRQVSVQRFHSVDRAAEICEQRKDGDAFQFGFWVIEHVKVGMLEKLVHLNNVEAK